MKAFPKGSLTLNLSLMATELVQFDAERTVLLVFNKIDRRLKLSLLQFKYKIIKFLKSWAQNRC